MRWVTFCRVFFIFEAAFAAVLNLYVLVTVWRRRIDSNASTYRIGMHFIVTNHSFIIFTNPSLRILKINFIQGITVVCLSAIVQSLLQCFTVTVCNYRLESHET